MVLSLPAPASARLYHLATWAPILFSWMLAMALLAFFAWAYLSNPKPGPYGICYEDHGRQPCHYMKGR